MTSKYNIIYLTFTILVLYNINLFLDEIDNFSLIFDTSCELSQKPKNLFKLDVPTIQKTAGEASKEEKKNQWEIGSGCVLRSGVIEN